MQLSILISLITSAPIIRRHGDHAAQVPDGEVMNVAMDVDGHNDDQKPTTRTTDEISNNDSAFMKSDDNSESTANSEPMSVQPMSLNTASQSTNGNGAVKRCRNKNVDKSIADTMHSEATTRSLESMSPSAAFSGENPTTESSDQATEAQVPGEDSAAQGELTMNADATPSSEAAPTDSPPVAAEAPAPAAPTESVPAPAPAPAADVSATPVAQSNTDEAINTTVDTTEAEPATSSASEGEEATAMAMSGENPSLEETTAESASDKTEKDDSTEKPETAMATNGKPEPLEKSADSVPSTKPDDASGEQPPAKTLTTEDKTADDSESTKKFVEEFDPASSEPRPLDDGLKQEKDV